MNFELFQGDCLEVLKELPDNSMDSMVTDPPAGISFMGKAWDEDKGGRKQWIAWLTSVMSETMRVLKPGAHALVWAIPRTSHWTATALEDAGFQIRDVITHHFGSGFPKSYNITKGIDKQLGAEPTIIGKIKVPASTNRIGTMGRPEQSGSGWNEEPDQTIGTSPEAKQWQGWGTALKPASEHWILCRKPLEEKTVAANVLKWGCGGLNIDASRVAADFKNDPNFRNAQNHKGHGHTFGQSDQARSKDDLPDMSFHNSKGRFPANLVLSHNPDCVKECSEGCAVAMLDEQSGSLASRGQYKKNKVTDGEFGTFEGKHNNRDNDLSYGDKGGASRFFYCAKASKSDKNAGLEYVEPQRSDYRPGDKEGRNTIRERLHNSIPKANHHPTVKSTKLMSYLIKLITPPGGLVLDPFMGSGTTGVSAVSEGFIFIGIEKEVEYLAIAEKRLSNAKVAA